MPKAVSRRQYRMMMAILHGDVKDGPRGRPPKSVAAKYTAPDSGAAESKHNDTGGTWGEKHHAKAKEKVKEARRERKKSKKDLKKAFEDFYKGKGRAAAALVMDNSNRVLLATHSGGMLAFPGGHVEPNESYEDAALRELNEETGGCIGRLSNEIYRDSINGNETVVYLAEIASGKPKNYSEDGESMSNWKWYELDQIPWDKLRDCCRAPMKDFIGKRFAKSLKGMMAIEALEKATIEKSHDIIEVAPNHALKLVGNGLYRKLKLATDGMSDEDFKEIKLDTNSVNIRKHTDGTYSGRVNDGHKTIYQFTNKHLHELAAALMSVFEWYMPEDEDILNIVQDQNLSDDAVHGGLAELIENYKRHNLGNIYQEMETIRETMRNGVAIDLQQVESRITSLFDKLEDTMHDMSGKHNQLVESVGKDMDELEMKLRELQSKIDSADDKGPQVIEAFSANPANKDKVHDAFYSYLSKPKIEIMPSGKITISFSEDWQNLEKENFLKDMRAKVISKAGKTDV